ncbi:MAG: hypothetical protein DSY43_00380 [Gammaproteobacteria bacterium]|nr:MAG: hypothetical protein DSY43_00380 [Gammaproteobacteria bacterium]
MQDSAYSCNTVYNWQLKIIVFSINVLVCGVFVIPHFHIFVYILIVYLQEATIYRSIQMFNSFDFHIQCLSAFFSLEIQLYRKKQKKFVFGNILEHCKINESY